MSTSHNRSAPELTIIIPTRNEMDGIEALLQRLCDVLHFPTELIFVDDSDDATGYRLRRLVERQAWGMLQVRMVHRPLRRRQGGLGGAVVEGIRRARAQYVAVMDADLQHPPEAVVQLLDTAIDRGADLVVATRYEAGGSADFGVGRRLVSRGCAAVAKGVFPRLMRQVSDPMSGFFLFRRDRVDPEVLHPHGFKILLEIIGRHPELTIAELGYHFNERYAGISKTSLREGARFAEQLATLRFARHQAQRGTTYTYDIHGLVSMVSERRLPELDKFRVRRRIAAPSIHVGVTKGTPGGIPDLIDLDGATPRVHFQEKLGRAGFVADIEIGTTTRVVVSEMVARSPHVLYTNVVEPILRWHLVERGVALVHCAAFAADDRAYLITARTDTGKTTTMLKVLDREDYAFLSDDLLLVDSSGRTLTYPKPLTISAHTVHALHGAELAVLERAFLPLQSRIHSRSGRRFAFLLTSKHIPVASLNAVVQIIVPPPKYHVERLVPGVALGSEAHVAGIFVIERADHDDVLPLSPDETIETLLANCDDAYGFRGPRFPSRAQLVDGLGGRDRRSGRRRRPRRRDRRQPLHPRPHHRQRRQARRMSVAIIHRSGEAARATRFVLVGVSGLLVNTVALGVLSGGLGLHYLIGVVLATQCSTTWNFLLAERWVFHAAAGSRTGRRAIGVRYLQFSTVNNAALLVRGPLIVLLTDRLGVHYLLSSLLSLAALFVARYFLADRVIWRLPAPAPARATAAGG